MGSPPAAAAAAAPSSAARQGDPVAVDAPDAEVIVGVDQTLLEEELLLEAERLKKEAQIKEGEALVKQGRNYGGVSHPIDRKQAP